MKEHVQINGNTLIDLGFKPKKWFKEAIAHINAEQLAHDEMLAYLEQFRIDPEIELHENPIAFAINIEAENEIENQCADPNTNHPPSRQPSIVQAFPIDANVGINQSVA